MSNQNHDRKKSVQGQVGKLTSRVEALNEKVERSQTITEEQIKQVYDKLSILPAQTKQIMDSKVSEIVGNRG
jgi:plasmid rolling circle replication initiator protein Rep